MNKNEELILNQYKQNLPNFLEQQKVVRSVLHDAFSKAGIEIANIESRVKTYESLEGKLRLKGSKYHSLEDITDILGFRIITFYIDDVDKVASVVERLFQVDWENSVDKRKLLEIDSFGYLSLHYICSYDSFPFRFEVQMRTLLQHAWANMDHDTGYKSGVEVPRRYLRSMSRLASLLELVDDEFSKIRIELTDYKRRVQSLVASGNLDEVPLDGDTFRSYLQLRPFDNLNNLIASINQAEIEEVPLMPYLEVFKLLGCQSLGDISRLIRNYSEGAYQIACYQIGLTDLDIISSSLGPQDLCIAYLMKTGGGRAGIRYLFDILNGKSDSNDAIAALLMEQAPNLPFMNQ
ncbi:MAG: hypothetical protein J6V81_01150 [Bacteroidales bacterium]|nr:hypothetical protein [Bacteroidales bacterium]MBP5537880.1 hypothetical protein [Bacteroidales bacterium]